MSLDRERMSTIERLDNYDNLDQESEVMTIPYLLFKINDVLYGINGSMINSVFVLEQPITHVPMTPPYIRGIINVRSCVVPVIDMRVLFGLPTTEQTYLDFAEMIDLRKQEHLDWVEALKVSAQTKGQFTLATDPHKCNFGKWYDTFETNESSVSYYLRQIAEPHQKLHECADKAMHCLHDCVNCQNNECLNTILEQAITNYAPKLLSLIDQMRAAHSASGNQMVIVVQIEDIQMGLLVDSVVEVTDIPEVVPLSELPRSHRSKFVNAIGVIPSLDYEILMIDVAELTNVADR